MLQMLSFVVFHRLGELSRRHIGVDEILFRVVDVVELEIEIQHLLHAGLNRRDHALAFLTGLRHDFLLGDEFVEHRIVVFELLVERFVIPFLADMHGPDQIDRQSGQRRILRHIVDDGRFHRQRILLGIAGDADKWMRLRLGAGGRRFIGSHC